MSKIKKLKSKILIIFLLIIASCNQDINQVNTSESKTLNKKGKTAKNLSDFVPENYSILDTTSGDLNLDGINDFIVVLKKNGEDTLSDVIDNPERRPLLILLRDQNNKFTLTRRNNNTVYCFDCGGVMGDPFMGIIIKNGYFSVEHYGGSSWRWTRIITYKYSKQDKEWFLHKDGSESFHASEPQKVETKIKTTKDFGQIKFEEFDIYDDK